MFGKFTLFKGLVEKVWQMTRSARGLLIILMALAWRIADGQFTKLSTHQSFPLYNTHTHARTQAHTHTRTHTHYTYNYSLSFTRLSCGTSNN